MRILAGLALCLSLTGCMRVVHAKSAPAPSIEAIRDAKYLASVTENLPAYREDVLNAAIEQDEISAVEWDLAMISAPGGDIHEQIELLRKDVGILVALDQYLNKHEVL